MIIGKRKLTTTFSYNVCNIDFANTIKINTKKKKYCYIIAK
jgi:hypothetical protein